MSGGKNRLLDVLRALPAALVLLTEAAVIAAERDEELAHRLEAVVHVHAEVPPEARTAAYLGTARDGSGVVIDDQPQYRGHIGYVGLALRVWVSFLAVLARAYV
jgi:hypothetical protein